MVENAVTVEPRMHKSNLLMDKLRQMNPLDRLTSTLMDKHHPYGLLLMATPFISAATGGQIDSAGLSSSALSVQISSNPDTDPSTKLIGDTSFAGSLGLSLSGHAPEASLSAAGLSLSLMGSNQKEDKGQGYYSVGALLSVLGASAGADPALANALRNSFEYDTTKAQAMIMPLLASAKKEEFIPPSEKAIEINNNRLRSGSVLASVFVYKGHEQYTVTGSTLDKPYVIKPGDKFLTLHVNQNGPELANIEPLSRIKAIRRDFQQLCQLLENPERFNLDDKQIEQIKDLREAPIIGVSHLVRLIAAKGLPAWDVQILPGALQRFHTLDSQIVSRLFGGNRKVKIKDIKVMFLPASMRTQVV